MFNNLSDRLQDAFDGLRGKGRLTEADITSAMREIRMALLEADVNFKVVKQFVANCKERCLTSEVLDSLTPAQNVVAIVLDQLTELLGSTESRLTLMQNRTPNVIMLVGLQGSGKTTAAVKLAYLLKKDSMMKLIQQIVLLLRISLQRLAAKLVFQSFAVMALILLLLHRMLFVKQ